MNLLKKCSICFLIILLSSCSYLSDPPRKEGDGRIDDDQIKRDIDIPITRNLRLDTENQELLFECKILEWWCVKEESDD